MSRWRTASYLFVVGLFIADRLLKIWFLKNPGVRWDFIKGLFGVSLVHNRGIAFGIPLNQTILFVLIAGTLVLLVRAWLAAQRRRQAGLAFGLSLIVAGAVSNLIDRLRYGAVIDYLDVPFFTVFNFADVMISGGVVLLLLAVLRSKTVTGTRMGTGQKNQTEL